LRATVLTEPAAICSAGHQLLIGGRIAVQRISDLLQVCHTASTWRNVRAGLTPSLGIKAVALFPSVDWHSAHEETIYTVDLTP
jgi:hypothetical protein